MHLSEQECVCGQWAVRWDFNIHCSMVWVTDSIQVCLSEPEAFPEQKVCWLSLCCTLATFHHVQRERPCLYSAMQGAWKQEDFLYQISKATIHFSCCVHRGPAFIFLPVKVSLWPFWEIIPHLSRELPICRWDFILLFLFTKSKYLPSLRLSDTEKLSVWEKYNLI